MVVVAFLIQINIFSIKYSAVADLCKFKETVEVLMYFVYCMIN